ncbi:hypothetical protein [Comamonas kerstersii]|uniref:hypothetical protein n=1 Tax=Comamonas kerstersii TaxID=225992 RepID=UPI0013B06003|nr:hypothetical protein [Comamonas kerstersii]
MLIWVYAGQDTEVLARQMATMLRLPVPAVMSVVDDVDDSFWEYFNHHEWLTATSMPLEDTLHPSKISSQKNERLGRVHVNIGFAQPRQGRQCATHGAARVSTRARRATKQGRPCRGCP